MPAAGVSAVHGVAEVAGDVELVERHLALAVGERLGDGLEAVSFGPARARLSSAQRQMSTEAAPPVGMRAQGEEISHDCDKGPGFLMRKTKLRADWRLDGFLDCEC